MKLTELDWSAIKSSRWGTYYDPTDETKRKKQSEFLVPARVDWTEVRMIGVRDESRKAATEAALGGATYQPPVVVRADWYY